MVKTTDVLTHPTPAAIPPSRPEATKIASLPMDAPFTMQGRREFDRRGVAFSPTRPELADQLFPGGLR